MCFVCVSTDFGSVLEQTKMICYVIIAVGGIGGLIAFAESARALGKNGSNLLWFQPVISGSISEQERLQPAVVSFR